MLENCALRAVEHTNINNIKNRVALIEKTPRIREDYLGVNTNGCREWTEHLNWCCGDKGDGREDIESRDRRDFMLIALGYKL